MKFSPCLFLLAAGCLLVTSCNDYGEKVSKDFVEVYYKDNVNKAQAQQTLDLLHPSWNEEGNKKSVQLVKKNDTVHFRMVVNTEKVKSMQDETFLLLANGVSTAVFNNAPVNVDLTDDRFNTLRTLHFKKIETQQGLSKQTAGNIEVYLQEGIAEAEASELAAFLDKTDGDNDVTKSFHLAREENGYRVSMVSTPERSSTVPEEEFYALAALISDKVFNGAPVSLLLTDQNFAPYQSFKHPR